MRRACLPLALVSACLALSAQAPATRVAFAPGGRLAADLEAGDYTFEPGAGDAIVVTWTTDTSGQPTIRLEGAGSRARLSMTRTPHQNFRVRVEVPARCDLQVRLTAGDLRVGAIEGHKDLFTRAGDLWVAVPNPGVYGPVRASVWAGDIHARAFGGEKGGLFRSFEWKGGGPYALRAATWAGDITLAP